MSDYDGLAGSLVEMAHFMREVNHDDDAILCERAAAAIRALEQRPTREQFILVRDMLCEQIEKKDQRIKALEADNKAIYERAHMLEKELDKCLQCGEPRVSVPPPRTTGEGGGG